MSALWFQAKFILCDCAVNEAQARLDLGFRHFKLGPGKNSFAQKKSKAEEEYWGGPIAMSDSQTQRQTDSHQSQSKCSCTPNVRAGSCYIDGYFGSNTFIGILKKCFAKFFRWDAKKCILFCFHRFSLQEKVFKTFFCSLAPLVFSVPIIRYAAQNAIHVDIGTDLARQADRQKDGQLALTCF